MPADLVRFGDDLELDRVGFELRRSGTALKLERIPMEILFLLVERKGQLIGRADIVARVWGKDVFLDTDNSINSAIRKIRMVLRDDADKPRFIQTISGRGYRFIAKVSEIEDAPASEPPATLESPLDVPGADVPGAKLNDKGERPINLQQLEPSAEPAQAAFAANSTVTPGRGNRGRAILFLSVATLALSLVCYFLFHRSSRLTDKDTIVLADFTNTTGDTVFDDTLRQGLSVQLEQSPFLSLVSDERIRQILRLMAQPSDARLTPEIARDLCQRAESTAVLEGSIAKIGIHYLLILKAVNCASGETLASTEAQAGDKNHVLDALGEIAAGMRNKLGESLGTVQQFDMPLEQATTPSLDALKAFSMGMKALTTVGVSVATSFFKQAIQLDPNFALAYAWLGLCSNVVGEPTLGAEYTRKAYELRDRVSLSEKYLIMARFNKQVTGNMQKAEQACQVWIQAYPRAAMPHTFLAGSIYPNTGQYEKSVEEGREAIRLNPAFSASYSISMLGSIDLDRIDQANVIYQQALERKLTNSYFLLPLYEIAFLKNDAAGMTQQVKAAAGNPVVEGTLLATDAESAAFFGRLKNSRELSRRAEDSAERAEENETTATFIAVSALREGLFGNKEEARRSAILAVDRSTGRDVQYGAALALAYGGDDRRAQALTDDLARRFPEDTVVQFNFVPTLRAKLAADRGNLAEAIEGLRVATPYELGQSTFSTYGWTALYPIFVRGEVYLAAHRGAEAAGEFQTILAHRGIALNSPIAALAHLQLARAYALNGDKIKAKAAFQDFLSLWQNADPEIPILKQAKADYLKLN